MVAADTYRDEILHRTDVVIDRSWSTALEGDLRATEAVLDDAPTLSVHTFR